MYNFMMPKAQTPRPSTMREYTLEDNEDDALRKLFQLAWVGGEGPVTRGQKWHLKYVETWLREHCD